MNPLRAIRSSLRYDSVGKIVLKWVHRRATLALGQELFTRFKKPREMNTELLIDPYLFEQQLEAFKKFVEEKSGIKFSSFAAHPYIEEQEGYKYDLYVEARKILDFASWDSSKIGGKEISSLARKAIELNHNNLIPGQRRYGTVEKAFISITEDSSKLRRLEGALFSLFHEDRDCENFNELVDVLGKKYPLIAYLFFLKDRSKYLPISPTNFDKSFSYLGVALKTAQRCSWSNYSTYLKVIKGVRKLLSQSIDPEVSLLDAHSFIWMLVNEMEVDGKPGRTRHFI